MMQNKGRGKRWEGTGRNELRKESIVTQWHYSLNNYNNVSLTASTNKVGEPYICQNTLLNKLWEQIKFKLHLSLHHSGIPHPMPVQIIINTLTIKHKS